MTTLRLSPSGPRVPVTEPSPLIQRYDYSAQDCFPGTQATAHPVVLPASVASVKLVGLSFWAPLPINVGQTATCRLYRYRKQQGGPFFLDQVTSAFIFDDTTDWAVTYERPDLIEDFTFIDGDVIAASTVLSAGDPFPAVLMTWVFDVAMLASSPAPALLSVPPGPPAPMKWPPV
jgi:hypothetical protein